MPVDLVSKRQRIANAAVTSATALIDAASGLTFSRAEELQLSTPFQDSDFTSSDTLKHTTKEGVDAVLGDILTDLNTFLDAAIQPGGASRRSYLLAVRR